jgi:hypothetical protein
MLHFDTSHMFDWTACRLIQSDSSMVEQRHDKYSRAMHALGLATVM